MTDKTGQRNIPSDSPEETRLKYEKPGIETEEEFETYTLSCSKFPPNTAPPTCSATNLQS